MATKKNTETANVSDGEKIVKRKSNGRNSPVIGDNGLMVKPGDNTKYLQQSLELMNLSDIDLHDPKAVQDRLNEYFGIMAKYDNKPTVAGMAMALGMNRHTLCAIRNDRVTGGSGYKTALPPETALLIKKAYLLMENLWENYMQNGKINPVSGIFLGKNNFNYLDKIEYKITPGNSQDNDYDAEDIRQRYLIDSTESSEIEND